MERKIGEIFEYNGEWYQCVVAIDGCRECSFRAQDYCTRHSECFSDVRSDGTSVIFKKLEKVGEPYEFDGHLFQSYRTFEVPIFTENYATVRELGNNSKISIEIKQNKEYMKENHKAEDTLLTRLVGRYVNNLIDYETFEKAVKELYSDKEESKPVLKGFDLEAAKSGKPVCTRDGRKARIVCFDRKYDGYNYPIVAMVNDNNNELIYAYTQDGLLTGNAEHELDLMMLTEKKEGWVNVYRDSVYDTKDEALIGRSGRGYIDTIKVSWEE